MPKAANLAGRQFGRLKAIRYDHSAKGGAFWMCACSCGNTAIVRAAKLISGWTKSCGCFRKEVTAARSVSHGHARSLIYERWKGIHARCSNPNHRSYKYYGARGIRVCERWKSFENFLSDMGLPPSGLIIDRINNDGNYEPNNCRWTTQKISANNRRPRRKAKSI